jgi:hypothetical protein
MQPSQMMTSRELCVAEDSPGLPAWKRPCGSRGVGSWRGAHLAMLVVRPFGRCSSSLVFPAPPSMIPLPVIRGVFHPPLARPAPEGTARCEPLTFAPLRSFHPSPWPIQRPSLLGSSTRPGTEIPDDVPLRPSIDIRPSVHSRADPRVVASASRVPPPKSRSVLVVSHHLDGFLRCVVCGLVASRCQSWGPPRCYPRCRTVPLEELLADSRSASPRSLPPCRSYRLRGLAPSSSLVSPPAVAS